MSPRHFNIRVERGKSGFGLSLIYRGTDKFKEEDTGTYVAKVVPGGNSARAGLKQNDRVLKINNRVPRDVNDAVNLIKKAGKNMILTVERREENQQEIMNEQGSGAGSVRSFNTQFGATDSRPHSPGFSIQSQPQSPMVSGSRPGTPGTLYSSDEETENDRMHHEAILRQQQEQLKRQAELIAEEERRQHEARSELERQQAEIARKKALMEKELFEEKRRKQAEYDMRISQQQEYERKLAEERERQLQAAEIQRQAKLQAELDNVNRNVERRSRRDLKDSSDEEDGGGGGGMGTWAQIRSKSLDGRKSMRDRSKSPGSFSTKSGFSFSDLTDEGKLSRKQEKEQMQGLNNRLAGYIDKVRQLQTENRRIVKQIEVIEESQVKEINDVKTIYEREVRDLKAAIDELTGNYRTLQTNSERILTDNRDLKNMQEKKSLEIKQRADNISRMQQEALSLKNKISAAETDNKKNVETLSSVLPELKSLKQRLEETAKQTQEVLREKRNLEDMAKNLESELKIKVKEMEEKLSSVKGRKQAELNVISGKLEKEYEDRVQKMLNELRQVYEKQMIQNRDEFTKKYDSKVAVLQTMLSKERAKNSSNAGELEENQRRVSALVSKVNSLEGENLELNKNIEKLICTLEQQTELQKKQMASKDSEIRRLLEDISKQMELYQSLLSTKTALDMEIAVYRKLVESEEDRLGIKGRADTSMDLSSSSDPGSPDVMKKYRQVTSRQERQEFRSTGLAGHTQL